MSGPVAATVIATEQVTPAMRRLVLGGPGIAALAIPPGALGPYLKFHVGLEDGRRVRRTYSVRRHDPARGELHVDVLLHSHGVGAALAARLRPGETVHLSGPGHIPAEPCPRYLLAGDHCALPAIANILETLPACASVHAIVEVPASDERQGLSSPASAEVTWLVREAGAPSVLADRVCAALARRTGDLLVWAGAEARIARRIRAEARRCGIASRRVQVLNYWAAGRTESEISYMD